VILALIWATIRKKWRVVAILATCLLPFLLFKYNRLWVRFHFQIIGAGTTSLAYLLTTLHLTPYRRALIAIAAALVVFEVFVGSPAPPWQLKPDDIGNAKVRPGLENTDRFIDFRSWGDARFAAAIKQVEQPGTTFALAAELPDYRNLAAWNPNYTNRVVWINWQGSGPEWETRLNQSKANAVYTAPGDAPLVWAGSHPERFQLIAQNPKLGAIFRIRSE
jgi:hypothetical protein